MGFPTRLLSDGEEIELDLRPHWVALVAPVMVTGLLLVGLILVLANIPPSWPEFFRRWVPTLTWVAVLLVFVAYPVRLFLRWVTSHFVLTNERVIHRSGFFAKRSMELPLERINDVAFRQSLLERITGAGDLIIESAGEYGQNHFTDIRKPEQVQKRIYEMYEDVVGRALPDPTQPGETPVQVIERLASLKERGHITPEEFEAQKRKILDTL